MTESTAKAPPPAELQFRRSQLIIDRQWQGLVLFSVGGWMLLALSLILGHYYLFYARSLPTLPSTFFAFCADNRYLLLALIVLYLLALRSTLIFSHRCAGPLFALMRAMKNIRAGDPLQRLHFRKHDHFQQVAAVFNDMVDTFRARSREKRKTADHVADSLSALSKRTDLSADCRRELDALQQHVESLRTPFFL